MLSKVILRKYFDDKSNELIIVRMLLAFAIAISWVIPPLFLKSQGFSNSFVGMISSIIAMISLLISLISTIILEKFNEYKVFLLSLCFPLIFLGFLSLKPTITTFIIYLIFSAVFETINNNSFSIIFKDTTKNNEYTRKESIMFSLLNVGWFLGPLLAGLIIENYGFIQTFGLSAIFYLASLILSLMIKVKLKKKDRDHIDNNLILNVINYFKQKELAKSYIVAFSTDFWYALIFTFIPLFMTESNLGEAWVGIFIALTQFPLIFIEFKLNWFVKKIGMKRLLNISFAYLTITSLILFFISNIFAIIFILFTTSFVLGLIEPLREIYLFKSVKKIDEEKTYPVFGTAQPIGGIAGKAVLAGVLFILPKNYVFMTMAIFMGLTTLVTLTLKNYRK